MATIPQAAIDKHSAPPSASKTSQVASLHKTIREILGDSYDTFLQGSYRNDTGLADINDVDIVARRKGVTGPIGAASWEDLFTDIRAALNKSWVAVVRDKCVAVSDGGLKADVVPAVALGNYASDPVGIWSRRARRQIENYPRTHYANGVRKQAATGDTFKATVRLFKGWARQYQRWSSGFGPSYYIESAVHYVSSARFDPYLPKSFYDVGRAIASWTPTNVIKSVADDKDILVEGEWSPSQFREFTSKLSRDLDFVRDALNASTASGALGWWKAAFGD